MTLTLRYCIVNIHYFRLGEIRSETIENIAVVNTDLKPRISVALINVGARAMTKFFLFFVFFVVVFFFLLKILTCSLTA